MKKSQEVSTASPEYRRFIEHLKARVLSARLSAARAVNCDLILLYWDIGRGIVEKQQALGWGESVVEMVAADLRRAFPQITGFSPRNVWDMRRLYATYTALEFLAQAAREIDHVEGGQILRQAVAEFGGDKKRLQAAAKLTESKVIELLRQLVAEVPWGQNLLILNNRFGVACIKRIHVSEFHGVNEQHGLNTTLGRNFHLRKYPSCGINFVCFSQHNYPVPWIMVISHCYGPDTSSCAFSEQCLGPSFQGH